MFAMRTVERRRRGWRKHTLIRPVWLHVDGHGLIDCLSQEIKFSQTVAILENFVVDWIEALAGCPLS